MSELPTFPICLSFWVELVGACNSIVKIVDNDKYFVGEYICANMHFAGHVVLHAGGPPADRSFPVPHIQSKQASPMHGGHTVHVRANFFDR
jgi:hypothetical protein